MTANNGLSWELSIPTSLGEPETELPVLQFPGPGLGPGPDPMGVTHGSPLRIAVIVVWVLAFRSEFEN